MITPLSSIIGISYVMVPVWTWQAQPSNECDHEQTTGNTGTSHASQPDADASACPSDLRLVFGGYQWRPVAHWEPDPHRGLELFADSDAAEAAERAQRRASERHVAEANRLEAVLQRIDMATDSNCTPDPDR